ncbi:MAG: alpha/beta hydrolase [Bacteroidota bacterium]
MSADLSPVFFAHANGFPSTSYQHFFKYLQPYQVYHEDVLSPGAKRIRRSWGEVVPQLIDSIERQANKPVIGLGHSFGTVILLRAAQQRPDLFKQLIIMEPPLLPLKIRVMIGLMRGLGLAERYMPLAKQAHNRKDHFSSHEEARTYWGQKKFFQSFDPVCFEDYVQNGLVPDPKGGFNLKIPKEKEANIFSFTPSRFGDTSMSIPAHYIYATHGHILLPANRQSQEKKFPDFQFYEWKGGHMFPLESPQEAASLIKSLIIK